MGDLGRGVSERRVWLGLSQEELAERSGLTQPTISRIETGDKRPMFDTVVSIAKALRISLDDLISGSGQELSETAEIPPAHSPSES